jgi:hypothetical protein
LDGVKFPVAVNGQHLKKYFLSMWEDEWWSWCNASGYGPTQSGYLQGKPMWYSGLQVDMIEYFAVHQATSRDDQVPCGISGCRSVSIGYFKSRCNASGCKVERDEQVRSVKKEQYRSALGAEDWIADVKPSTLEAIIGTCKSRASITSKEVGCGCLIKVGIMDSAAWLKSGKLQGSLDLKRKGFDFFAGFLGSHIFSTWFGLRGKQ